MASEIGGIRPLRSGGTRRILQNGAYYEDGVAVEKDEKKAFGWYQKAAVNSKGYFGYDLGRCYENGVGVGKDETKAFETYRQAANLGDEEASYALGRCYEYGIGIEKNEREAFASYRKSTYLDPAAYYAVGRCYELGIGVEKDVEAALLNYREAAALGDENAKKRIEELEAVEKGTNADAVDFDSYDGAEEIAEEIAAEEL